jgi:hypothetical protein
MIDFDRLLHLQGTLIWLPCTLLLYAGSSALHRRLDKAPIANPTLLTIGRISRASRSSITCLGPRLWRWLSRSTEMSAVCADDGSAWRWRSSPVRSLASSSGFP